MQRAVPAPLDAGVPRDLTRAECGALVEHTAAWRHGCVLLDVRGVDGLRAPDPHVRGAAWVPLSGEKPTPVWLLPARGRAVVVVGDAARAPAIAARLRGEGWPAWWYGGDVDPSWLHPGPPPGALWDIDPYLRSRLDLLSPATTPVLDLGCGSAREGVHLAQAGHRVLAVDRLADALALARRRARHHGVHLETLERRVRGPEDLPRGPFAAVLMFRFCEQGILAGLGRVMTPGGVLVLRAFGLAEGEAAASAAGAGPRRPTRRIRPSELVEGLGPGWTFLDGPRTESDEAAVWTVATARWTGGRYA